MDISRYTQDADLAREYIRFLQLKFIAKDFDAQLLSPSGEIDAVWHRHILDTRRYYNDCITFFGRMIHHDASGADADQEKAQWYRYSHTYELYWSTYDEKPHDLIWPQVIENDKIYKSVHHEYRRAKRQAHDNPNGEKLTFSLKMLTGRVFDVTMLDHEDVMDMKLAIQDAEGIPPIQIRLVHNGKQLEDQYLVKDLDTTKGINLVIRLTGC